MSLIPRSFMALAQWIRAQLAINLIAPNVSPSARVDTLQAFADARRAFNEQAGGSPAARNFLLLRQKKVTKEKATRSLGPFAVATGNLRCSEGPEILETSRLRRRRTSKIFIRPLLRSSAQPGRDVGNEFGFGLHSLSHWERAGVRAVPESAPEPSPTPSGCAGERRFRRIRDRACLSAASLRETPSEPSTAGCPQRSVGTQTRGRLSLGYFSLAKQRKVTSRRATPGIRHPTSLPPLLRRPDMPGAAF
jgi:hypothetical protein